MQELFRSSMCQEVANVTKNRVSNRADKSIKHLLHMAALSVSQVKNSPLKKYYDRKVEEGKIRCRF